MYGWRGRLGLILPSCNTVMEPELWKIIPEGISIHSTRMPIRNVTEEELVNMSKNIEQDIKLLLDAGVNIILYGCTSGSFVKGSNYNRELENTAQRLGNVPLITTSSAVLAALEEKQIHKVGVVTPYTEKINEREEEFLVNNGFKVSDIQGLGLENCEEIGKQEPYVAYRLSKNLFRNHRDIDGLFISCTNFRSLEMVPLLAGEIGKPVITSNQASLWYCLQLMGISHETYNKGG